MRETNHSQPQSKRKAGPLFFFLVFISLCLGIIACSAVYYVAYEEKFRDRAESQLSAIAELKVNQLLEWRRERSVDASIFFRNSAFEVLVKRFINNPGDTDARERLLVWLGKLKAIPHYDRVFLFDARGNGLLSVPDLREPIAAHIPKDIARVLRSGNVTFLDFHRDAPGRPIHLTLMVPLFDEKDNNRPLAALVLRINPFVYLYPFIQEWPVPSGTSETLIARREGDSVIFLNELKFEKNTALRLKLSLEKTETPVVQAVLGYKGVMEGIDYRGKPVLAAVRDVPGSPWFIVARMDIAEVYAPLRERWWQMALFICFMVIAMGACLFLLLRQQRMHYYRERLKDADALRESEEKFRNVFDNSAMGKSITAIDGTVHVNPAFCEMLGYTLDELSRKKWQDLSHPDDYELTQKNLEQLHSGEKKSARFNKRYFRKDGSIVWADVSTVLQKDKEGKPLYYITAAVDISDLRKAETALRDSEKRLRRFYESGLVGVIYWNMHGQITNANDKFLEMIGYTRDELETGRIDWVNMTPPEFKHLDEASVLELKVKGVNSAPFEKEYIRKDGSRMPIIIAGAMLDETRVDGVAFVLDITDRKRLEEKLQQFNAQLEQKTRDLEQLIFVTSHDLRSPLVNVQGFAKELAISATELMEAIQAGDVSAEVMRRLDPILKTDIPQSLEYIQSGIARMDTQLSALLKLSRLGRLEVNPEKLDMNRVVTEVIKSLEYVIKEKGADITVAELPPCTADAAQMNQIFCNLIDNALKYLEMERHGVIRISGKKQGNEAVYCVEDNGIGIALEYQNKVFEIFYRVEHSKFPGDGLGLTIVRKCAERLNGAVWVESEPGKGSRFFVKLPGV